MQPNKVNMNEMDYARWNEWKKKKKKKKKKEIKTKHDQWSVDWRKSDETWTIMKYELTEMRWNIEQWNR